MALCEKVNKVSKKSRHTNFRERVDIMKHGYKEVRKLFADDLINLCVRNRWYTCGYNTVHYHFLYEFAERKENITTGDIVELAEDIMKSSDTDLELTSICSEIAKTCKTFFVEA